jgi:hypothetical protein
MLKPTEQTMNKLKFLAEVVFVTPILFPLLIVKNTIEGVKDAVREVRIAYRETKYKYGVKND